MYISKGFARAVGLLAAGLLVVGCLFPGHVLFEFLCRNVCRSIGFCMSVLRSFFLRRTRILEADAVTSGAKTCHLAWCLHLAPWGPWDDPGAPGSTRKDILGCRLGFL